MLYRIQITRLYNIGISQESFWHFFVRFDRNMYRQELKEF